MAEAPQDHPYANFPYTKPISVPWGSPNQRAAGNSGASDVEFTSAIDGLPIVPSFWTQDVARNEMGGRTEPSVIYIQSQDMLGFSGDASHRRYREELEHRVSSTRPFFAIDTEGDTLTVGLAIRTMHMPPPWDGQSLKIRQPYSADAAMRRSAHVYHETIWRITRAAIGTLCKSAALLGPPGTEETTGTVRSLQGDAAKAYYNRHDVPRIKLLLVFGGPGSPGHEILAAATPAREALQSAKEQHSELLSVALDNGRVQLYGSIALEDSAFVPTDSGVSVYGAYQRGRNARHASRHAQSGEPGKLVHAYQTFRESTPALSTLKTDDPLPPERRQDSVIELGVSASNGVPLAGVPVGSSARDLIQHYTTTHRHRGKPLNISENVTGLWPYIDGKLATQRGLHSPAIGPGDPAIVDIQQFAGRAYLMHANRAHADSKAHADSEDGNLELAHRVRETASRIAPQYLYVVHPNLDLRDYASYLVRKHGPAPGVHIKARPLDELTYYNEFHVRNALIGLSEHGVGTVPIYLQTPQLLDMNAIIHLYLEDDTEEIHAAETANVSCSVNTVLSDRLMPLVCMIFNFANACAAIGKTDHDAHYQLILHVSDVPIPLGGRAPASRVQTGAHPIASAASADTITPSQAIEALLHILHPGVWQGVTGDKPAAHVSVKFDASPCPWRRRRESPHTAQGTAMYMDPLRLEEPQRPPSSPTGNPPEERDTDMDQAEQATGSRAPRRIRDGPPIPPTSVVPLRSPGQIDPTGNDRDRRHLTGLGAASLSVAPPRGTSVVRPNSPLAQESDTDKASPLLNEPESPPARAARTTPSRESGQKRTTGSSLGASAGDPDTSGRGTQNERERDAIAMEEEALAIQKESLAIRAQQLEFNAQQLEFRARELALRKRKHDAGLGHSAETQETDPRIDQASARQGARGASQSVTAEEAGGRRHAVPPGGSVPGMLRAGSFPAILAAAAAAEHPRLDVARPDARRQPERGRAAPRGETSATEGPHVTASRIFADLNDRAAAERMTLDALRRRARAEIAEGDRIAADVTEEARKLAEKWKSCIAEAKKLDQQADRTQTHGMVTAATSAASVAIAQWKLEAKEMGRIIREQTKAEDSKWVALEKKARKHLTLMNGEAERIVGVQRLIREAGIRANAATSTEQKRQHQTAVADLLPTLTFNPKYDEDTNKLSAEVNDCILLFNEGIRALRYAMSLNPDGSIRRVAGEMRFVPTRFARFGEISTALDHADDQSSTFVQNLQMAAAYDAMGAARAMFPDGRW